MPTYEMKCRECGDVQDVFCTVSALDRHKVAVTEDGPMYKGDCATCDCETFQFQAYRKGQKRNHIHSQHSGMYGKYHPGFGEVVRDYAHKQQLLKKYDMREAADPIDGSRTILGDSDVMGDGYVHDPNRVEEQRRVAGKAKAEQQKAIQSIQWA